MFQIQQVRSEHLPLIQGLAYEIWKDAYREILSQEQLDYMLRAMYSEASLYKQWNDLKHSFLLIRDEDRNLGFSSYSIQSELKQLKIHKLYILPSEQGKGLGRFVIQHIEKIALDAHLSSITLNVNRYNHALFFYQTLKFAIVREENIDIGNGFLMEDFVLQKEL